MHFPNTVRSCIQIRIIYSLECECSKYSRHITVFTTSVMKSFYHVIRPTNNKEDGNKLIQAGKLRMIFIYGRVRN